MATLILGSEIRDTWISVNNIDFYLILNFIWFISNFCKRTIPKLPSTLVTVHQEPLSTGRVNFLYIMPTPGLHFYRTSLTQTLSCVGSWSADGNLYMIVSGKIWAIFLSRSVFKSQLSRINILFHLGEVWEYWQPGEYKNSDKAFSCMSLTTDGMKIFLSQVKYIVLVSKVKNLLNLW